MTTIIFSTNIDAYNSTDFVIPENMIPRKGECVSVKNSMIEYYKYKKFPTTLQVVDVTYFENYVKIELHFREIDMQIAKVSCINLFEG